jgi:methylated-DNA-[protein]-cysteine S-methyltransferase
MATELQTKVWAALHTIPKGKVTTYGALAKYLKTKAVRSVGSAVGKNPNAPTCPCHRVVRGDGSIGQYSGKGGAQGKIALLKKEGVQTENGKIALTVFGYKH